MFGWGSKSCCEDYGVTPPTPSEFPISTNPDLRSVGVSIDGGGGDDTRSNFEGGNDKETSLEDFCVEEVKCAIKISMGMGYTSDYHLHMSTLLMVIVMVMVMVEDQLDLLRETL